MQNTIWRWRDAAAVFSGGCLGGAARYGVGLWFHDGTNLLGTTAVNLTGSFLLALITYSLALYVDLPDWLILALGTGFVGAFTTFSTLFVNVVAHAASQPAFVAVMLVVNLVGGLAAAMLGYWVATAWAERYNKW